MKPLHRFNLKLTSCKNRNLHSQFAIRAWISGIEDINQFPNRLQIQIAGKTELMPLFSWSWPYHKTTTSLGTDYLQKMRQNYGTQHLRTYARGSLRSKRCVSAQGHTGILHERKTKKAFEMKQHQLFLARASVEQNSPCGRVSFQVFEPTWVFASCDGRLISLAIYDSGVRTQ